MRVDRALLRILGVGTLIVGGCSLADSMLQDHERICRAKARIIVHDRTLWEEYVTGNDKSFHDRKMEFPETGRAVPESVPGFEFRFGPDLKGERTSLHDQPARDDIYILKGNEIVAQFVDYVIPKKNFIEGDLGIFNCTGLFPQLYNLEAAIYE